MGCDSWVVYVGPVLSGGGETAMRQANAAVDSGQESDQMVEQALPRCCSRFVWGSVVLERVGVRQSSRFAGSRLRLHWLMEKRAVHREQTRKGTDAKAKTGGGMLPESADGRQGRVCYTACCVLR
jgi:hypothetical protein